MKVTNRSGGNVVYSLPELNIRRLYALGESKNIPTEELNALYQTDGGAELIKNYLFVEDEAWVEERWEAPIEYFWGVEDIKTCLLEDDLDLFVETLEYAPPGIVELLKEMAWQIPLTDLNKIEAIKKATGFDVLLAINVMKPSEEGDNNGKKSERKRKRKES